MKRLLILGVLVFLSACGKATQDSAHQTDPAIASDPEAILNAATEAVLAVNSVSYDFELSGFSIETDTTHFSAHGNVVLKKGVTMENASVFVDYSGLFGDQAIAGAVASNGTTVFFVDSTNNEFSYGELEAGAARLLSSVPQGIIMVEYLIPDEPYGAELNADSYDLLEPQTVAGRYCYVVQVNMDPYSSTWWFDTETLLPVSNRISVRDPQGFGFDYTITLDSISVNSPIDSTLFELSCPDGFSSQEYLGSVPVGSMAPLWTLPTPDGNTISLEDLRGKIVVMDFWATWCGPCRAVMPTMQEVHETYGDEVSVIGVNTWETGDPVAFMDENGYTYQMVLGGDGVAQQYLVEGIPTFYVIAPDGTVAFHAVGAQPENEDSLKAVVARLLNE